MGDDDIRAIHMDNKQLKQLKYPNGDLFVIDALDVIIKDDMPTMEHPFYSLSKKPDRDVRRYEHKDKWIEFRPSIKGLPTIYDKDLIIYAISNLVAAFEEGEELPKEVEIDPYAFFLFTQRGTGGRAYDALRDSLDRLDGTRFRTNITMGGVMVDKWQGIIDDATLITNSKNNKPELLRIKLSDMVLNNIKKRDVLTLNRDYFRLKKPIERRIYELARKHVGMQSSWEVRVDTLHKKTGTRGNIRLFRQSLKHLHEHDHLPDYHINFDTDLDKVSFTPRDDFKQSYTVAENKPLNDDGEQLPPLATWAIDKAKAAAPSMDVYELEQNWREMWKKRGCQPLENHNAAFIGFCKTAYSSNTNQA